VSKWTAYDMLKELTSDGLVRSSYSTSKSAFRGRSQVLFEPTASGLALLGEMANTETDTRHRNAESGYASVLERAKAAAEPKPDLHEFLAGLKDASPLAFCASLIGALVGEFKRRGLGMATVEAVLAGGVEVGTALPLVIGVMAGALLVKGALKKTWNVDRLIARFAEEVQRMEEGTKGILVEFAQSVMIPE
jgi:hypothetical protein